MNTLDARPQAEPIAPAPESRSHYDEVHCRVVAALSQETVPGQRVPSDRQLAQQFGVSNVTIGRVMHDLQRAGIVQRVPGKGTYLNGETLPALKDGPSAASSIPPNGNPHNGYDGAARRGTSPNARPQAGEVEAFAWIVASFKPDDIHIIAERWALRACSSIERSVQRAGGRTMLTNSAVAGNPIEVLQNLRGRGVNQIIIISDQVFQDCPELGYYLLNEQEQRPTAEGAWSVVQIPLGTPPWPFDAVRFDDERGVYAAVSHLWNLGHRAIAYAALDTSDPLVRSWVEVRVQAFERAVSALSGGQARGTVLRGKWSPDEVNWHLPAADVADRLLNDAACAPITGLVAANDAIAAVIIETVRQHGRRVPEDLSVVGFDDEPWSSSRGLTTIHVPVEEIGEQAARLALRRLAEPDHSQRIEIVLQPILVVRETTAKCLSAQT